MTVVQPKELSIEDYLTRVLALVRPLRPCGLPLRDAFGCVLAADVRASCDLPPFHSSAMDGYAVNSADTTKATPDRPVRLRMTGEVGMGHPAEDPLPPGGAMAVPTGGMMPPGADAVAPVEDCAAEDGVVELSHPVEAGRHVRRPGEDLLRGEMLVPAGRRLEAADLGLLAAAGHAEVSVIPRPAVGLLSTGNELVGPGGRPGGGQIFESNSFLLDGLIRRAGGQPQYCGAVPDDPDALQAALCAAAGSSDLLVCSGGVSAGRNDPVRRAFPPGSGVEPVQIAVQPGRPQAAGTVCGKPFFGLPGNPMAALVAFELFVAPAVRRVAGRAPGPFWIAATCGADAPASSTRTRLLPALMKGRGTSLEAVPLAGRGSNRLASLAGADALMEVPAGAPLARGSGCRILWLRSD